MQKIPTVFVRDLSKQPPLVTHEWNPGCAWVRDGEGRPTVKHDGTCCLVKDGILYKRREFRAGQAQPPNFTLTEHDATTGKTFGWVPCERENHEDKYHWEAFIPGIADGTYELMGPKIQGNKEHEAKHALLSHGAVALPEIPRSFEAIRSYLEDFAFEGIVWHHPDGRMAKIKRRDFGFKW